MPRSARLVRVSDSRSMAPPREILRRSTPALRFVAAWLAMGTVLMLVLALIGAAVLR